VLGDKSVRVSVVAAVAFLVLATPASAELRFCNKTGYPIAVAIGSQEGDVSVSEGWWRIQGGTCAVVISGDLTKRYIYFHAKHEEIGGEWSGDYYFCVSENSFTIEGDKNCESRGYTRVGFIEIDTGDERSWTHNLND
jgi:uncharacterized membrane protein